MVEVGDEEGGEVGDEEGGVVVVVAVLAAVEWHWPW